MQKLHDVGDPEWDAGMIGSASPTSQEGTFLIPRYTQVTDPQISHDPKVCARVSSVFAKLGDRWSMRVVSLLSGGPRRFNEIKRAADGISQRMLTLTLRNLERDGLVKRTAFPAIPPRVEYELTELGRSMFASVRALGDWTVSHLDQIEAARSDFDQRGAQEGDDGAPASSHPYASRVHRMQ
jgi:DNA-binding HxlR family transcriptional regulator